MNFDLFQENPGAFILSVLFGLVITLVAYGAFPLFFAKVCKNVVAKKRYRILCFVVNFLVKVIFVVCSGDVGTFAPYLLWTALFSAQGIKIMNNRFILNACPATTSESDNTERADVTSTETIPTASIPDISGTVTKPAPARNKALIASVVILALFLVTSVCVNFFQFHNGKKTISAYEEKIATLEDDLFSARHQLAEVFTENIGLKAELEKAQPKDSSANENKLTKIFEKYGMDSRDYVD